MNYYLASTSPRRKELLKKIISNFEIIPSNVNENLLQFWKEDEIKKLLKTSPQKLVMKLAEIKAKAVIYEVDSGIIIGADTTVFFENNILGKPIDKREAKKMLKKLSGNMHIVITGITLLNIKRNKIVSELTSFDLTKVYFNNISENQIDEYIEKFRPFDKAGSYGIQDEFPLVENIVGDYDNVMGFPVKKVQQMIEDIKKE